MRDFFNRYWANYLLILILIIGAGFRIYGINWDQSQHLHPDERFLTMVGNAIRIPGNLESYFSTDTSPLNPANQNYRFFVYGTFPLFFNKILSEQIDAVSYDEFAILGRFISAVFDLLTIVLIFLIARKVFSKPVALLAAFLYATTVLAIQLSHFFAVDTFLSFFMTGTLYTLVLSLATVNLWLALIGGLAFGLALASKISALLLGPTIAMAAVFLALRSFKRSTLWVVIFTFTALMTFRIAQPYAFTGNTVFNFTINPLFIENLKELQRLSGPSAYFPPSVQWFHTQPVLYPLTNLINWGLGIPLGIVTIAGLLFSLYSLGIRFTKPHKHFRHPTITTLGLILLTITSLTIFIYQGFQFAKPLRYFFPMLPSLMVLSAYFLFQLFEDLKRQINRKLFYSLSAALLMILITWPVAFASIYTQPHTRVTASEWIYQNIPPGSTLSAEHWDDALPLNFPTKSSSSYELIEYPLYGPDTQTKWTEMMQKLQDTDYIILSSNRLYGSITSRGYSQYPATTKYYQMLFDGSLGFSKVAEFTSRPQLALPFINTCIVLPGSDYGIISHKNQNCEGEGLIFIDDYTDEFNTVYDHPKVTIFKKNR